LHQEVAADSASGVGMRVRGIDFGGGGAYALRQLKTRSHGVSMAEKKIEKCAHPGCNCPATPDRKYCVSHSVPPLCRDYAA